MRNPWLMILFLHLAFLRHAAAQEKTSFTDKLLNFPSRFNDHIQKKTEKLEVQLTKQTEKYLQRLARKEEKLRKKLQKTDSTAAKQLFEGFAAQYAKLSEQLKKPTAYSAGAELPKASKDVGPQSIEANPNNGEISLGIKVGVAIEVMVNPINIGKAFVHAVGVLFEFTKAAADEQVPLSPEKRQRFNQQ